MGEHMYARLIKGEVLLFWMLLKVLEILCRFLGKCSSMQLWLERMKVYETNSYKTVAINSHIRTCG